MFRALEHEGVAAECLFELFAGERRMTSDQRVRAFSAASVVAVTLSKQRDLAAMVAGFLKVKGA